MRVTFYLQNAMKYGVPQKWAVDKERITEEAMGQIDRGCDIVYYET